MIQWVKSNEFVLCELIKRDFLKKYKRTILGLFWSVLSPLLLLAVMNVVFSYFFARSTPHYTIYLFSGFIQYQFFISATTSAMSIMYVNAPIYSKIKVNKIFFVISSNVSQLISYLCTLCVYFIFIALDGMVFTPNYATLIWPVIYLTGICFAISIILSTLFVFIRDIKYIYPVITRILMYASGIFYNVTMFPANIQRLMWLNPLYPCIFYFREVVISGRIPDIGCHMYMLGYLMLLGVVATVLYKKLEKKFYIYV